MEEIKMNIKTAFCEKNNKSVSEIADSIKKQFGDLNPKLVIYFSSPAISHDELSQKLKEHFSQAELIGCTTSGEIISGKMLKESVVAMALSSGIIDDVKVAVIKNIKEENNVEKVFKEFEDYFKIPMSALDFKKYVGIILVDGLTGAEEKLMDTIGDLTNITFIGGSAGDDLQFKSTNVFANGKSYGNAAVLTVIKPKNGFDIIKTQSFKELDKKFTATKVNPAAREVIEFNNEPAAKSYAKAVGVEKEKASEHFMNKPVGLMIDDEPYVRSPQQIKNDSMIFYCNVLEGMELSLLESGDIITDTKKAIEDKKSETGEIAGLINFHCILRTLELEQKQLTEEYGKIFSDIPTIGFSTYGEEYIGHINQTSTMLVFK
jgi:hypothetical protein